MKTSLSFPGNAPQAISQLVIARKLLAHTLSVGVFIVLDAAALTWLPGQLAANEIANQLFLSPSAVPITMYTPTVLAAAGSVTFAASQVPGATVINNVAVLPVLLANPFNPLDGSYSNADLATININNYSGFFAYTPTVDYSASDPGSATDTVTFNKAGTYFVQLQTDAGNQLFEVDVASYLLDGPAAQPTGPERQGIPQPSNNMTTIISNALGANYQDVYNTLNKAQVATNLADVVADIAKASMAAGGKIEVTLVGHGSPGSITIGTDTLNSSNAAQFQMDIEKYVSSIHFFSCNTGQSTAFLAILASSLGYADGYNGPIRDIDDTGTFDVGATTKLIVVVTPEPMAFWLVQIVIPLVLSRSRRRASIGQKMHSSSKRKNGTGEEIAIL